MGRGGDGVIHHARPDNERVQRAFVPGDNPLTKPTLRAFEWQVPAARSFVYVLPESFHAWGPIVIEITPQEANTF